MSESISLQKSNQLKSIAILMMLFLHLFNRDYSGLFEPLIFMGQNPLSYYISLFCDACVPIFAFVSGYGLYYKYSQNHSTFKKDNVNRLKKLYINYWIIIILFVVLLGYLLTEPGHGIIPNFVVAPFTALVFIFMFLQLNLSQYINRTLDYFAPHATNLWLIHMFFYLIYFKDFVYGFKYVPIIFIVLIGLCLVSSYLVNFANRFIQKRV